MNRLAMYRGMVVREGTIDDNIVRQVWDDYGLLDFKGRTVIDGGAHIGAFTDMALQKGAEAIFVFEPEKENYKLLYMNISSAIADKNSRVFIYKAALGAKNQTSYQDLYTYSNGKNRGMHTLIDGGMEARGIYGYSKQKVTVEPLDLLIIGNQPNIIKLDIEGSETGMFPVLLSDKNPASQMAIEFHAFNDEMQEANIEFVNQLMNSHPAWDVVKRPMVHEGHQSTVGVFKR